MTVAQAFQLLRRYWASVIAFAVLGVALGAAYGVLVPAKYQATTQLIVSTTQTGDVNDASQGGTYTQQRLKSYGNLVTTPLVLDPVIKNLGLRTTAVDLAPKITVDTPAETLMIYVTVTDGDPRQAATIANGIASTLPDVVDQIETPRGQTRSLVKLTIVQPAVASAGPVSPNRALGLAAGLLVGLALGVGVAVLRDQLDSTIATTDQVEETTGAPVLGVVNEDRTARNAPLIVQNPFSQRAEAFRQLCTNIRFLGEEKMVTSFVVTSAVAGEGKSITAANLAIALAQTGENVVLIDADLRRPTLATLFGITSGPGLTDVLLGQAPPRAALHRWRNDLGLDVITAGPLPSNPSELVGSASMAELVQSLAAGGHIVIMDSPPLLPVTDAAVLGRIADGALVVARAASTRSEQLASAVNALHTVNSPLLGIVLNRATNRGQGTSGYGPSPDVRAARNNRPVRAEPVKQAFWVTEGPVNAQGQPQPRPQGQPQGQPQPPQQPQPEPQPQPQRFENDLEQAPWPLAAPSAAPGPNDEGRTRSRRRRT